MKISNEALSLQTANLMRLNNRTVSSAMEQLSSGMRINRGADDPSGIAIYKGMQSQVNGLNAALENMQDGLNLLRTAESGLQEASEVVLRIRDIAVRAANEVVLTDADRSRLQAEVDSLIDELNRSAQSVTWNKKHLNVDNDNYLDLNATFNSITVNDYGALPPAQTAAYDALKVSVSGAISNAVEKVYGMLGMAPDPSTDLVITYDSQGYAGQPIATGGGVPGLMQININLDYFLDLGTGGPSIGYNPTDIFTMEQVLVHEMTHAVFGELGGGGGDAWGQEMLAAFVSGEADARVAGDPAGVTGAVATTLDSGTTAIEYAELALAGMFIAEEHGAGRMREITQEFINNGFDMKSAISTVLNDWYKDGPGTVFEEFEKAADAWSQNYIDSGKYNNLKTGGFAPTASPPGTVAANAWYLQVGANSGERIDLFTPWSAAGTLDYIAFSDVTSQAAALRTLSTVDRAVDTLGVALSDVGVQQRVIMSQINDVSNTVINLEASMSKIGDSDIATAIVEITRAQIMSVNISSALTEIGRLSRATLELIQKHL